MKIAVFLVGRTIPAFTDIINTVSKEFKAKIGFNMIDLPTTHSFDSKRKQYNAEQLLRDLFSFAPPDADKAVYIIREDIFAGNLSFVFGLAADRACIVSTARLDPRFYGEKDMEKARSLFKERLIKEIIHELGHTLGLPHCEEKKCVMVFSNSIEDVDFKGKEFCKYCSKALYKG